MPAVNAATCQVLSTESPVDQGHHIASYDTSLIVSGGVDCGRRRRSVYDKKPQRYIKDNRTAHLTARSDKSVAYVTNNKRLYRRFVRVDYTIVWSGIHECNECIPREAGITYLFHDRPPTAKTGLRTTLSTGVSTLQWSGLWTYGTLFHSRHCVER